MARILVTCLAACAALALLAVPSAAAQERAWSPFTQLAPAAAGPNDLQLVATSAGEAVAVWIEQEHDDGIRVMAAVRRADGTLDGPVLLAPSVGGCVLDIATDAAGGVVVAWSEPDGTTRVVRRPARGGWGSPEIVRPSDNGIGSPQLGMNPQGDAAIVQRRWDVDRRGFVPEVTVSRGGGAWSRPVAIGPARPENGGADVAITPSGEIVGAWILNAEPPGLLEQRAPSEVHAAALRPDGTVSAPQTLRRAVAEITCPQVEANALGQVALLWHEVEVYCGNQGGDVLALRPAGAARFDAAHPVPGAQSAASRGRLTLGDDGRVSVTYDRDAGGQLVSGPFGGPLAVTSFAGESVGAFGGDPAGAGLLALDSYDQGVATVRHRPDGTLGARQPLLPGGEFPQVLVDEGGGRGAALVYTYERGLALAVDGAPGGGTPQDGTSPAGSQTGGSPSSPGATGTGPGRPPAGSSAPGAAPQGAPQSTPLTQPEPFLATVRRIRLERRAAVVDVSCPVRCTARAVLTLRAGKRVVARVRSRPRAVVRRAGLRLKLPRAAARRLRAGRRVTAHVRLSATAADGRRSETVARHRLKGSTPEPSRSP